MCTIGSHAINADDSAQRNDALVRSLVAHDANGLDGHQHGAGLPDLVVQGMLFQSLYKNMVHFLQDPNLIFRDVANDPNTQSRTWERMTPQNRGIKVQRLADKPDLIFE